MGVAEVGLGRAQVRPVGLRLESVGRDSDELVIDALVRGLAQQVLDHPLAFVVLALAEVVVPDPAFCVCEVDGRPVPVGEGAPYPVVVVERDRVLDPHRLHGLADVLDLALERELGRMDADHDEPQVAVFRVPRAHEGQRAQPVDAGVRPEIDEHDLPTQLRRSERRRVQPAGRPLETREVTLDGQRRRARMAARAEEAHARELRLRAVSRGGQVRISCAPRATASVAVRRRGRGLRTLRSDAPTG